MRRLFKNFIVLSCFSLLLFFRPTTVLANTVEQDDLKVKFTVEQNLQHCNSEYWLTQVYLVPFLSLDIFGPGKGVCFSSSIKSAL